MINTITINERIDGLINVQCCEPRPENIAPDKYINF